MLVQPIAKQQFDALGADLNLCLSASSTARPRYLDSIAAEHGLNFKLSAEAFVIGKMTVVCCSYREEAPSFRKCQKDVAVVRNPIHDGPSLYPFIAEKLDGALRRADYLCRLLLREVALLISLPHLGLRQVERGGATPEGLINNAQGRSVVADGQSGIHDETAHLLSASSDRTETFRSLRIAQRERRPVDDDIRIL